MREPEDVVRDLTLMLIYLTSWTEAEPPFDARRAWKGYDFGILNKLTNEGLLEGSKRAKSIYLTEEGENKARELLTKYEIKPD